MEPDAEFRREFRRRKFTKSFLTGSAVLISIGAFYFFTGAFTIGECYAQPKLPVWMIVVGVFILAERVVTLKRKWSKYIGSLASLEHEEEEPEHEEESNFCEKFQNYVKNPFSKDILLGLVVAALIGTGCLIQIYTVNINDPCSLFVEIPTIVFCVAILYPFSLGVMIMMCKKCKH